MTAPHLRARKNNWRRTVPLNLALALAYIITARLGLLLAMPGGQVTAIWPPSGIALAAVILGGWRVLPGIFLGSFALNCWVDLSGGHSHGWFVTLWSSAALGAGAAGAAGFGAWALKKLGRGRSLLESAGAVFQLLAVGGLVSCLISATVGTLALRGSLHIQPELIRETWLTWWLGDAGGVFIFTPLILAATVPERRRLGEMAVCLALLSAVAWYVFASRDPLFFGGKPLGYLALPFMVWAALRMGLRGATTGMLIVATLAVWGTAHGRGPYAREQLNDSLLSLDIFLASWVLVALSIAAVVREREKANAALQQEHYRMSVLASLTLALSQRHELASVLDQIVRAAAELLPASGGASVLLWDAAAETFTESASSVPQQSSAAPAQRVRRAGGASRWVVDHDQPAVVPDVAHDPFGANPMLAESGLRAYAGVPMRAGGRVIGVLYALDREPREYAGDDLMFLSALANRAATAILKVQLYEELSAARDHLEAQVAERTTSLQTVAEALRRKNLAHAEAEAAARAERDFSDTLIDSLPGVFYLVNPERRLLRWNNNLERVTGYSGDELRAMDAAQLFLAEDLPGVQENFMKVLREGAAGVEARLQTRTGQLVPHAFTGLRVTVGDTACMVGVGLDITERRQAEALLQGQKQILEMIAAGAPLGETLAALIRRIESQAPGMLGSILLLDEEGLHVRHGAAPSLPLEFVTAIDGQAIGPCAGSCGTAAYRREAVFVEDIATDPLWAEYKTVALRHGLHASWSTPVLDAQGRVLGTFAIYYRQPGLPQPYHLRLIEIASHTAVIALERKRAEQAVEKSRAQLRALLARLQRAREEERTRIAREVHDVLGQLLTGLKMDLAWCDRRLGKIPDPELRAALTEKQAAINQLTDTMIDSVQKISRELRPSVLDNLGLAAAIQSEARQFQERSGIACDVVATAEALPLEADRATDVFRIFQEALTNVARHSQATAVRIRLARNAGRLVLEVADNGRGISEEKLSDAESLGLLGMRERAAAMGGELQLRGAPETGTTVTLTIPEKNH